MRIGISGKKTAGKDYFGTLISRRIDSTIYKFATPLYNIVECIRKGDLETLRIQIANQSYLADVEVVAEQVAYELMEAYLHRPDLQKLEDGKPRKLLQWVGTDYFRATVHKDWWIKIANAVSGADIAIFTDVRFANEAAICDVNLRVMGGDFNDKHISEDLDFPYDYIIDNTLKSPNQASVHTDEFVDWLESQGHIGDHHRCG